MSLLHPADAAPQDEMQKDRCANRGHNDADRQLGGPHDHARDNVGDEHQNGAEQRAAWEDDAVVGPRQQPHEVGHDNAAKPITPATATAAPTEAAVATTTGAFGPFNVDAEMKSLCLAKQEAV
jgi:hypothetical protein